MVTPRLLGWRSQLVLSGSMAPAYPVGSVVFVDPLEPSEIEALQPGDVVTFRSTALHGATVTHRVLERTEDGGELAFRTKGDANEDPDPWLVHPGDVVGEVRLSVPHVGRAFHELRDPDTLRRAFVALLLAVIARESVFLLGELQRARRAHAAPRRRSSSVASGAAVVVAGAVVVGAAFAATRPTSASLADRESIAGTRFSAGGAAPGAPTTAPAAAAPPAPPVERDPAVPTTRALGTPSTPTTTAPPATTAAPTTVTPTTTAVLPPTTAPGPSGTGAPEGEPPDDGATTATTAAAGGGGTTP